MSVLNKPSHNEVKDLLQRHNLSGSKTGEIIDADGRTVRRYTSDPGVTQSAKPIPRSSWLLLKLLTGELKLSDLRKALNFKPAKTGTE